MAVALYGTTGVLEAARRALNVVFEVQAGRGFLRRKAVDLLSTAVLMTLVLSSLVMVFVGGRFADDMFGFIGLGSTVAEVWSIVRWPGALLAAMLAFAYIYYVTPDVEQRSFRWVTPGAIVGVLAWLLASIGLGTYLESTPTSARSTVPYGRDRAGGLAVAHERGTSLRGRAERGDRTREGDRRGGPAGGKRQRPDLGAS